MSVPPTELLVGTVLWWNTCQSEQRLVVSLFRCCWPHYLEQNCSIFLYYKGRCPVSVCCAEIIFCNSSDGRILRSLWSMAENVTVVRGSNRYQRQKKLCEGNVFTSVCQSFCGWVGMRCPRSLREWVCPGGLDMFKEHTHMPSCYWHLLVAITHRSTIGKRAVCI